MAKRNKKRGRGEGRGTLRGLPPLVAAYRIQEDAARVGFDWPDARGPLEKVKEEVRELEAELSSERTAPRSPLPAVQEEVGDLLFAVVNLARKLGIDLEAALARANDKFTRRFGEVERLAAERGLEVGRASLEELDRLWEEIKSGGRGRRGR
ncbi:MAG TPA: MazG nucleotide pyrophosphohydrolase domain-containing protein [Gemmatimonadales bacterium]|nr:MazG nucleotide pyrophosphohydrolase domain-containing protein [Gemmatimonadales bacterium]